jgi:hypothetical protein
MNSFTHETALNVTMLPTIINPLAKIYEVKQHENSRVKLGGEERVGKLGPPIMLKATFKRKGLLLCKE